MWRLFIAVPLITKMWAVTFIMLFSFCAFFTQRVEAQELGEWQEAGKLPLAYFDTSELDAAPPNWSITQDKKGIIYAGNSAGLLIYDGVTWKLVPIPGGNIVRSVELGHDGKVYIGSFGEVGYLGADSLGNPTYISLNSHIPTANLDYSDVWNTLSTEEGVFFQTETSLLRWKSNEMQVWEADSIFTGISEVGQHVIVSGTEALFYVTPSDSLKQLPLKGYSIAKNQEIIADGPNHLLVLKRGGLVRCEIDIDDVSKCTLQTTEIDALIQQDRPFTLHRLPSGILAIGFDGKGLALLDADYRLLRLIDDQDGLINLEVMNLFSDREGALWLALYDGIARVEPSTAWTTFGRNEGLPSKVNSIYQWQGRLFATTMLGIYELTAANSSSPAHFEQLRNSESLFYCEDMAVVNQTELITACNGGLARIELEGNEIASTSVLWGQGVGYHNIAVEPSDSSVFYLSGFDGLSKVVMKGDQVTLIHKETIAPLIFDLLIDPQPSNASFTRIWATAHPHVLYRIDIPHDDSPWETLLMGEEHNLTETPFDIFLLEDTLHVTTEGGLFRLKTGPSDVPSFARDPAIGEREFFYIGKERSGNAWVVVEDSIQVLQHHKEEGFILRDHTVSPRIGTVKPFTLFEDPEGTMWFGNRRGIGRIDARSQNLPATKPTVLISSISTSMNDSLLYSGVVQELQPFTVAYNENTLRFDFAAQEYGTADQVQYRVWMEGSDPTWLKWSDETMKEYTRLHEGAYTFHVQARNVAGEVSAPVTASFRVLPPWHRTAWAYALWVLTGVLLLGGAILGSIRIQTRRLEARNTMLNQLVEEQTKEIRDKKTALEEAVESLMVAYEEVQVINDDLIKTNQTLEDRTEKLRDALEVNKEILGITAHDLKNPLSGIIGLAELVIEDFKSGAKATHESAVDHLPMLKDEAERMLLIIKDLLDKHREGETSSLRKEESLLGDVASAVIRWNNKQAIDKQIQLNFHITESFIVDIDVMSIQRALDNYVSNAIKYSAPGKNVWIDIERKLPSPGKNNIVKVSVRDEGPGLTKKDLQKVFGKMQRLSAKPTAGEHSSGLGLYIVKKLVEAHGGTVGVDSKPGEGSTFWFTLPFVDYKEQPQVDNSIPIAG